MRLKPRQYVCVMVQRSLPMVIAIFAVLEAGWQYIPLDVQVMAETVLRRITKDTQAPFVLYFEIFHMKVGQLAEPTAQILVLDDSTMALLLRAAFQTKSLGSRGPPNGVLTEMWPALLSTSFDMCR
ncbi:uncharacterized protein L3040_008052 [Drepanopeziza brunnea f. sp. 'multigermtubi']|uniref:uncharacterized protein n=1 Tax=Drepanopeziza brunnea f. sp. 'multigermtubi' TaxID=698441 RepID=UPI00239704C7|nr:hypothetical protein L3040_008052 [Drepanopeziza brunnea f. sp. 'multigermtubi']